MNNSSSTRQIVWPVLIAALIAYGFMATAAGVSFTHIVDSAFDLGLTDWQRYLAPVFIDGFAALGKLGRVVSKNKTTRLVGLIIMAVTGTISLACNVYAGDTPGEQYWGIIVVGCFIGAEWYATRLTDEIVGKAPAVAARGATVRSREERLESAKRRAGYYTKMNPAQRSEYTRKWNAREDKRVGAAMPTSPGVGPLVPSVKTLEAATA